MFRDSVLEGPRQEAYLYTMGAREVCYHKSSVPRLDRKDKSYAIHQLRFEENGRQLGRLSAIQSGVNIKFGSSF